MRAKESGHTPRRGAEPAEPTKVIDLTDALRRSMERTSGRTRRGSKQTDTGSLSKSELDGLARALDVKGRSKMTKSELAAAVADRRSKRAWRARRPGRRCRVRVVPGATHPHACPAPCARNGFGVLTTDHVDAVVDRVVDRVASTRQLARTPGLAGLVITLLSVGALLLTL